MPSEILTPGFCIPSNIIMSTQNITSTNTRKLSGKVAIVTGASKGI